VPERACLTGIAFVLTSGIPWGLLLIEMGCGSGMTFCRRMCDWQPAGVWDRLRHALLDQLRVANQIDWERVALDSASVPAQQRTQTGLDQPGQARHEAVCGLRPPWHSPRNPSDRKAKAAAS